MPALSDEALLLEKAQEWKAKGNVAFQKEDGGLPEAVAAYSQGIATCDRLLLLLSSSSSSPSSSSPSSVTTTTALKATLLSNRAACHLKVLSLTHCIDDCTTALSLEPSDLPLVHKLLFRRSKARFLLLLANLPHNNNNNNNDSGSGNNNNNNNSSISANVDDDSSSLLQESAQDLLKLLQTDPHNVQANQLLMSIRAQHKQLQKTTSVTPVSKTLNALKQGLLLVVDDDATISSGSGSGSGSGSANEKTDLRLHQLKLLLAMLDNDLTNTAMEIGRLGGVQVLLQLAKQDHHHHNSSSNNSSSSSGGNKVPAQYALQCLSMAGSHPAFTRAHLVAVQPDLFRIIATTTSSEPDVVVSALAIYLRIILHADRDSLDASLEITGKTLLDYNIIVQTLSTALQRFVSPNTHGNNNNHTTTVIIRAVLDICNTFTAGEDRDVMIRQSLALHSSTGSSNSSTAADPTLPLPKTQAQVRAMSPPDYAAHRKREYEIKTRNQAWAYERSRLLLQQPFLPILLAALCWVDDHVVRREVTVVLGRLLALLEDEDKIKNVVGPYLQNNVNDKTTTTSSSGVIIEEVYNEDNGDEKHAEPEDDITVTTLETKMSRAAITAALLLSKKSLGAWALTGGWNNSADEISDLIQSGDKRAMCLASEVVSAAATVETARHLVNNLMSGGDLERLLTSDDVDIRSGAASAVAKLGLSNKETQTDEGEVMGMLQAACELLEDDKQQATDDDDAGNNATSKKKNHTSNSSSFRHFSSFATSSVERAVEMINYLIFHTVVKDELAAGFKPNYQSALTSLERLVKTADIPNAGESLSGFALATIFQHMAATNLQIRKEGFEGKEVTMEQYDEMQKLGKTAEEKEVLESQQDPDTPASCHERIRKMAAANVPRALCALVEKSSEHTLYEVVLAMNRMAGEASVRGILIQQGVLTACIKMEKNEGPTETDTMKKVIRLARHTIAKILVTTNPSLLTSAQKLGSIRPLISLVRDSNSSDLQQFEALMALTNLAESEDAKNRIILEKGIPSLHFAMFSDHEMVRRSATEAMSNLIPHQAMMEHLQVVDNMKLWLAFATDYEGDNYECARAAAGCLAMATQSADVALVLVQLPEHKFRTQMETLLESGRLEIMHRALVIILNLVLLGGTTKEKAIAEGFVTFCNAYITSCMDNATKELDFPPQEEALLPVTMELAQKIVKAAETAEEASPDE
jgi:protein unc-45